MLELGFVRPLRLVYFAATEVFEPQTSALSLSHSLMILYPVIQQNRSRQDSDLKADMRLLHAETWQLEEFMSEEEIPSYAILSHTWGKAADEVKLQDLTDPNFKTKVGYQKIEYCCAQALKDGYQWIWVDT